MKHNRKKIILAIAGEIASGKNAMADYVQKKHKGYAYRSSEFLRDILTRMDLPQTRQNMQKVSTMVREYFGDDIVGYVAKADLARIENGVIAINGIRRFSTIESIQEDFTVKLVYVKADLEKRYARIAKRAENPDDQRKTFQEFKKDHAQEAERRIKGLEKKADFVLENNGTLKEFHKKISEVVKKIVNKK